MCSRYTMRYMNYAVRRKITIAGALMTLEIPEQALRYGFVNSPVGTHGSRTIILTELRALFAACPASTELDGYRTAIVDDNVLLKKTETTRRESFRRLRELYALDSGVLLFRALRDLWDADTAAQPLLALLCACARDIILRGTAEVILATPLNAPVTPQAIAKAADESLPGRYNAMSLANIGRHAASSWQQSGHLSGRLHKVRSCAEARPASVAYALLLGYLCDARGEGLFHTLWRRFLDTLVPALHSQAIMASQLGWIDYRHSGNITDIGFRYFLDGER